MNKEEYYSYLEESYHHLDSVKYNGCVPDFVGLGLRKCGVLWLYDKLSQHPGLAFPRANREDRFCHDPSYISRLKEENNFTIHGTFFWDPFFIKFPSKIKFFNAYKGLFGYAEKWRKAGEFSATYFTYFLTIKDILPLFHSYMPNIKMFVTLRNPVDRFISDYFYEKNDGHLREDETLRNCIESAIDYSNQLNSTGKLLPVIGQGRYMFIRGHYDLCIQNILNFYDKSQLHVVLLDDVKEMPEIVLNKLCLFLDIDPSFKFQDVRKRVNVGTYYKDEDVSSEDRKILTKLYSSSIESFSTWLNRDLTHWLQYYDKAR